jgi:C-22 sterol desaturase
MESGSVPMPSSSTAGPLYPSPSSSVLIFLRGTTSTWFYTTAAIVASLLLLEQIVYRYKKRHLPGASWTIPLVGKFADSMSPSMEGYKKQWDSGALSAISVFNMYLLRHLIILQSADPIFLPASLSWLRQMIFLVRSSTPQHTLNLALCIRLSKSFVPITGNVLFFCQLSDSDSFCRVFLNGKTHVDYRRGLNLLFTRKALG